MTEKQYKTLGNEIGDQVKLMFKDGLFNPRIKNYNFATGCRENDYTAQGTSKNRSRMLAVVEININDLKHRR